VILETMDSAENVLMRNALAYSGRTSTMVKSFITSAAAGISRYGDVQQEDAHRSKCFTSG
jgi:hypothetical protein